MTKGIKISINHKRVLYLSQPLIIKQELFGTLLNLKQEKKKRDRRNIIIEY
jgi:hypothetical protein